MRKIWQFIKERVRVGFETGSRKLKIFKIKIRF